MKPPKTFPVLYQTTRPTVCRRMIKLLGNNMEISVHEDKAATMVEGVGIKIVVIDLTEVIALNATKVARDSPKENVKAKALDEVMADTMIRIGEVVSLEAKVRDRMEVVGKARLPNNLLRHAVRGCGGGGGQCRLCIY